MTGDRSLRDYDLESGDEAVIDDRWVSCAARLDHPHQAVRREEPSGVNDTVTLGTVLGQKKFTIRGVMKEGGMTSAFGGNLAIMDVYAAQKMFGRGRTFDRVDIGLKPGRTIADAERELQSALGGGFQIEPPSGRGQQFEAMLAAYSMMVNVSSLFAPSSGCSSSTTRS